MHDVPAQRLRPARRLLLFASIVTLALNVAAPLLAGRFGRALFDAVGPLLLIGWAEVGPSLLQTINSVDHHTDHQKSTDPRHSGLPQAAPAKPFIRSTRDSDVVNSREERELVALARAEDARHREERQRPISAETLRKRLRIGAVRSRRLVTVIRSERSVDSGQRDRAGARTCAG